MRSNKLPEVRHEVAVGQGGEDQLLGVALIRRLGCFTLFGQRRSGQNGHQTDGQRPFGHTGPPHRSSGRHQHWMKLNFAINFR